tara:strand:+ start:374 stop:610 length:237 start_codon:yes stop_codon:yes gene_type:complete
MEPVTLQKQIFNTDDSKDHIMIQVLKIFCGILLLLMFVMIGVQFKDGKDVSEHVLIPFTIVILITVANKIFPYKLFTL